MTTTTPDPAASLDQEARLANRVAVHTLVALCSFLVSLVAVPLTFQHVEEVGPRLLASAPLALGVGAVVRARAARGQLAALREESSSEQR